jgi:hypothetical protein
MQRAADGRVVVVLLLIAILDYITFFTGSIEVMIWWLFYEDKN